jgi:hypothetical protein
MRGYRLRVTLLSLGVVLGYGSAAAHLYWHGAYGPHAHCHHHAHADEPASYAPR